MEVWVQGYLFRTRVPDIAAALDELDQFLDTGEGDVVLVLRALDYIKKFYATRDPLALSIVKKAEKLLVEKMKAGEVEVW